MKLPSFFYLILLLCCSFSISSQDKPIQSYIQSTKENELKILSVHPETFPVVSVIFKAEKNGEPVWDVTQEEILVMENHQAAEVLSLEQISKEAPIHIGIIFDHSSSMQYARHLLYDANNQPIVPNKQMHQIIRSSQYVAPIEDARTAVKQFISSFNTEKDYLSLIGFSSKVDVRVPLTQDTAHLSMVMDNMTANGSTALYDAIHEGLEKLDEQEGIKIAVVLTDGHDNASLKNHHHIIKAANKKEIPLFIIGLGNVNHGMLEFMAKQTKGEFFHTSESSTLDSVYNKISRKIQAFYRLKYQSPSLSSMDTVRQIKLVYEVDETFLITDSTYVELPKEVKRLLKDKEPYQEYLMYGGIVVLNVVALGVLIAMYRRRRKKKLELEIEKVYPNPTNGVVYIKHNGQGGFLIINDAHGKEAGKVELTDNPEKLNFSSLNGLYFLQIERKGQYSNIVQVSVGK